MRAKTLGGQSETCGNQPNHANRMFIEFFLGINPGTSQGALLNVSPGHILALRMSQWRVSLGSLRKEQSRVVIPFRQGYCLDIQPLFRGIPHHNIAITNRGNWEQAISSS